MSWRALLILHECPPQTDQPLSGLPKNAVMLVGLRRGFAEDHLNYLNRNRRPLSKDRIPDMMYRAKRMVRGTYSVNLKVPVSLTTLPGTACLVADLAGRSIGRIARGSGRGMMGTIVALVLSLCLFPSLAFGVVGLKITGTIDGVDYNPTTGTVYTNQGTHATFATWRWGDKWSLSVTGQTARFDWWEKRCFDGTNTYVIAPAFFRDQDGKWKLRASQNVTISPSARAIPHVPDILGISLGCLTYGVSKASLKPDGNGLISVPKPWISVHDSASAWGYKWLTQSSKDSRFLSQLKVVRDRALDLSDTEEIMRFELDYPETDEAYDNFYRELVERRATPSGFMAAQYKCREWCRTNNELIPKVSTLEHFAPPRNGPLPHAILTLKADQIDLVEEGGDLLPGVSIPTKVGRAILFL